MPAIRLVSIEEQFPEICINVLAGLNEFTRGMSGKHFVRRPWVVRYLRANSIECGQVDGNRARNNPFDGILIQSKNAGASHQISAFLNERVSAQAVPTLSCRCLSESLHLSCVDSQLRDAYK